MLSRHVRQAGLLDRRLRYYAWKITLTALALAGGWTAFAVLGDSWWQLGTAVFLAAVFAQIGFLGHDAGHRQIFGSRRANYVLGILCGSPGAHPALTSQRRVRPESTRRCRGRFLSRLSRIRPRG